VLEFDESIRMALLVSALCNNSGITQKELEKDDESAESSERKKRRRWLFWNREKKESEEETGMLAHEESTSTWSLVPPSNGASMFTKHTRLSSS
jgi:hypothetical protein